jgi:uncharacterized cupredoxin-like copper-binding protein
MLVTLGACGKGGELLGEPGDEANVDRVIAIETTDQLRFDPSTIEVDKGETIEFQITNAAQSEHEFVLGPGGHEHSDGMDMGDPNSTGPVTPGDTVSLVWDFTTAGEVVFACHIAGHDKQGMTGTITISD